MEQPPKKNTNTVWIIIALLVIAFASVVGWEFYSNARPIGGEVINEDKGVNQAMKLYAELNKGRQFIDDGRYTDAQKSFRIVIEQSENPDYIWQAELGMARGFVGLDESAEAIEIYDRIQADSGDVTINGYARIGTAEAHASDGKIDQAIGQLNELITEYAALEYTKHCSDALKAMSSIYQVNKQYGLALAALQRIVDEFPGSENSDAFLAQRNIDRLEATIAELQTDAVAELEKSGKHNRVTSIPAGQTVTWTPADGPYLIEEMLTVPADSVVNIEAGTVLRFGMSAGLRVSGRVEAAGTADAPVRCLALSDDPSASLWSGLTFEASGDGMPSTLTHLHTSAARHAIAVTSGSVTVTDCTLQHSVRAGLMSRDAGSITAKNCQIVGGRSEGIVCENGGKVIVDGGRIADQARSGISVKLTRASSTVTGTVIENNGGDGVSFMTATGTLKDCRIRGNGGSGVVCRGDAAPTIEACDITENQKMGIACLDRSKPRITRTNIRMSKGGGIRFETASDGNVTDSVIEDNELFGVSCKLSNPRIAGSRITGNAEVGVDIESGQPKLHKNDLAGNKGITLRNQSSAVVDARENWWGSAEPAEIDKQIEDAADNADWGKVNYDPPLKNATEAKN